MWRRCLIPLYVLGRSQHAGLFRSGLRRAVCKGDNDNRSTADDVLASDHPACRDCFVPVQYRETVPAVFYRERRKRERLALSIGMFTRGEVGLGLSLLRLATI